MVYSIAFMMLFVLGGMTGIILANPTVDYQVHNTLFLVAHFHNMLIPGTLFGMLAGYHYWFPKAFGFRLNERWGMISAHAAGSSASFWRSSRSMRSVFLAFRAGPFPTSILFISPNVWLASAPASCSPRSAV